MGSTLSGSWKNCFVGSFVAAQREAGVSAQRTLTYAMLWAAPPPESERGFYTHSGPEIGVASTKAFLTQILSL